MANRQELLDIYAKLHSAVLADNRDQISKLMSQILEKLEWDPTLLAKRLDIAPQTYYRWINKVSTPRLSILKKLEHFLREEDLDAQRVPNVGLSDLGFHTWRHMAQKAMDPALTRMWVFSAERFLEEQQSAVAKHMWEALRSRNFEACYVFPKNSAGGPAWRRWISPFKETERKEGNGRTLGFEIADINRTEMFTHSVYEVLYEYGNRLEGFLAFPPQEKVYGIVRQEEESPRFPRLIWMPVDSNVAGLWFATYCRPLYWVVNKQTGTVSDKLAVEVKV